MCGHIAMCPYRNNDDKAVDVIGHEHEFVQFNLGTNVLRPEPLLDDGLPHGIHVHCAIADFPERRFSVMGTQCNKIHACLLVIV